MALPPPPSWLASGPCDVLVPCSTDSDARWIVAAVAAGDPEGVVAWAAGLHAMLTEMNPVGDPCGLTSQVKHRWAAAKAALRKVVYADRHPNAAFLLGRIKCLGSTTGSAERAAACELFERGWRVFNNIGCAAMLTVILPEGSPERETAINDCVRFVLAPDCLERARATGSTSAMTDALCLSAKALTDNPCRASELMEGFATSTRSWTLVSDGILRLYDLAAGLDDPFATVEAASRRMRHDFGGLHFVKQSTRGEELCAHAVALPNADPYVKAKAFALLGEAANERGDTVLARRLFEDSVRVCELAGGKWLGAMDQAAVEGLVLMCYEAIGGPHDVARGDVVFEHGVRLCFGPTLEAAAIRATTVGDVVSAMELWTLAAAKKMPRATSIVEGIPLAEAERRVDPFGGLLSEAGSKSGALIGTGGRGGPPGATTWVPLETTMPPPAACSSCGRHGRFASPSAAQAESDADLSRLTVATLRSRLFALGATLPSAPLEKAVLVGHFAAALCAVAAQPVLLACSRCRRAFYCQRADWAKHKSACTAPIASLATPLSPAS